LKIEVLFYALTKRGVANEMAIHAKKKTRKKGCGKDNNREEKFCGERSLNGQLILATQGLRESKTISSRQSACRKIKTEGIR